VEPRTLSGLTALLGAPVVSAHWDRMPPPTRTWLSRLLFFLPAVPWGRHGWKNTDAARAAAAPPPESGGPPLAVLELELLCLELLTMARPMHALFDDDTEGGRKASARNSVLPYQPHAPSSCPYPPVEQGRADAASANGGGSGTGQPQANSAAAGYSAVLLLLAPVRPRDVAAAFPQCLLLNNGGIGSEAREVFGSRLATRMLLQRSHPAANPPWVAVPAVYTPHLAVGVLSRLGGPRSVLLRHPHAARWGAHEGGEIAISAADLDDTLRLLFSKVTPPPPGTAPSWTPPKRVAAAVAASRLLPGYGQPSAGGDTAEGAEAADAFGLLLAEALVPSTALPQDGKKGWYDPTFRVYVASARGLGGGDQPLGGAKLGGAFETMGQAELTAPLSEVEAGSAHAPASPDAGATPLAREGAGSGAAGTLANGAAVPLRVPAPPRSAVVGGACRFPSHPLSAAASSLGHSQHVPTQPHAALGLGQSMAAAAFAPSRFDPAAVCTALCANPTSLRHLLTVLLTEPAPVMHLAAMAIMANAAAGVRQVHHDPGDALKGDPVALSPCPLTVVGAPPT
jgi:hypothetical protein